jgi:hypothetical protein
MEKQLKLLLIEKEFAPNVMVLVAKQVLYRNVVDVKVKV